MKFKILLLLGAMTLIGSCRIEDALPSDCYLDFDSSLNDLVKEYNYDITHTIDTAGYSVSLEACIMQRERTYSYRSGLGDLLDFSQNPANGCSDEERSRLRERIEDKIQGADQSIEDVWSHCEEIYGGD